MRRHRIQKKMSLVGVVRGSKKSSIFASSKLTSRMGRTHQPCFISRSMLSLVARPCSLASGRISSIPKSGIAQLDLFLRSHQIRLFETEAEFHTVADETLETIQDAVDDMLEPRKDIDYEVNLASGVLTLKMKPHGTWVLNKQTPNRQIWVRIRKR